MNEALSKKLSVYNFVCTMFIVIYHSKNFNDLFCSQKTVLLKYVFNLYDCLGTIAMGMFFMISGFLLYLGMRDKTDVCKKLKKRVGSLVIPFVVWNTLMLCYDIAYGILKHNLKITLTDIILGYTFEPFTGAFWYIFALMLLLTLCPAIFRLKDRPKMFIAIIGAVTVAAFFASMLDTTSSEALSWAVRLLSYLPHYLLGAFFGLCKSENISGERFNSKTVSALSAAATVLFVIFFVIDFDLKYTSWIIGHIIPITVWLAFPCRLFTGTKVCYPMKTTFFVYAMHMLLIGIFNTVVTKVVGYSSLPLVITLPLHFVVIAVIVLICNLFAYVTGKILPPKIYSTLSGGRV